MNRYAGRFDSPCGPIDVWYTGKGPLGEGVIAELVNTAGPDPKWDYPDTVTARDWHDLRAILAERAEMERLAELGREWREDEDARLEDLRVGPDVDKLFSEVLPTRAADRARAKLVIDRLRAAGYVVEFRHCAARCEPDPPPGLREAFAELQPYLSDLLTEETGND